MRKLLLLLLLMVQVGIELYINPAQVVQVQRDYVQGNRHHVGHYSGLTRIKMLDGSVLYTEWPIDVVLKILEKIK